MRLVLASTSRYRRELLDRLGVPYAALAHQVDERALEGSFPPGTRPDELALALAEAKARSLAGPETAVLGSDQLVDLEGQVLGKPGTQEAAIAQLLRMSGKSHRLLTAIALVHPSGAAVCALDVHVMTMRELSRAEAERYVEADQPLDCAGSYKIEQRGIALFSRIEGEDFTAIMGLPLLRVAAMLRDLGWKVP
ncbi:MAG: Maf family nucleotide pyrophosphatase [Myxococcota bacterium]